MGANARPRVSVVIPAYNSATFLPEALESVFAQVLQDHEVIVVNDGSPDTAELEKVIAPYAATVRYIVQPNRGPGGARNTGIREARADLIAFLDADDRWHDSFLATQVAWLERDPSMGTSGVLRRPNHRRHSPPSPNVHGGQPVGGEATFENLASARCTVITSGVVARRASLIAAGLFDEHRYHSEDFDLWLRLAHAGGRICYHRQILLDHRVHPNSLGAGPRRACSRSSCGLQEAHRHAGSLFQMRGQR